MAIDTRDGDFDDDGKGRSGEDEGHAGDVGRGEDGRFRKGRSGNPKGRPKKKTREAANDNLPSLVMAMLLQKHVVTLDGKQATRTMAEVLVGLVAQDIIQGPAAHRLKFLQVLEKFGYTHAVVQAQEYAQKLGDQGPLWNDELEEKYQALELSEEAAREIDDMHFYLEERREDFARWCAERRSNPREPDEPAE